MNRREFYKPVAGLLDTARLRSKKVAVIGLGSGGGRVAVELGRLGVNLLLVERPGELLEERNLARHVLDYRSLGKPKLTEMVRHLAFVNPSVQATACSLDVVNEPETLALTLERWRPDLIAVCTDTERSKHAVNSVALRLGIPQTGGAVYDGGIGGEVYCVRPDTACYGCIASRLQARRNAVRPLPLPRPAARTGTSTARRRVLRDERLAPEGRSANGLRASEPPIPQDYNGGENGEAPTTSALNLDIEQIVLVHLRLCLENLLGRYAGSLGLPGNVNVCVFANRIVPGIFARPLHCKFYSVPRRRDCLLCGEAPDDVEGKAERILALASLRAGDPG